MDLNKMLADLFGREIDLEKKVYSDEKMSKLDNREWNALKRALSALKDLIEIEKERK